jgi:pilus assembly protein CpaE
VETPIIALCRRANPQERVDLLGAGCNEYLVKTAEVMQELLKIIPSLFNGGAQETETVFEKKGGGQVFVFLSAKGGVGTSSLCANVAENLSRTQTERQVVVVDLVLPIGSIGPILGYKDPLNIATITNEAPEKLTKDYFESVLYRNLPNWHFGLLPGSPDPETGNNLQAARIPEIVNQLKMNYDYVFVDLGRSLSRISLPIIQNADAIVLVVGTDLSTVTLTRTTVEYLQTKNIQHKRMYFVMNRAVGLEGLSKQQAEQLIGLQINATVTYLGSNLTLANNQHVPLVQKFPSDSSAMMINQIASEINELGRKLRV